VANTTKPLTNTEVKQSKPKEKEYNLADGNGLYLRVKPNGTKLWLFNYCRPYTKKRTNLSLGIYPNLTLAEARAKAQEYKGLLAKDIDPKEKRLEEENANRLAHINTFEHVVEQWLLLKQDNISPSYYKKITSRLRLHVLPDIGKNPIHKITAVGTIESLRPLAKQGKMETIDNICGWLNEIMVYSVNTGRIPANPLSGIKKAFSAPKSTHLPTLRPEELPELTEAIETANIRLITKYLMQWQLHTMVRPKEASEARWDEIDLEKKLWVIPAKKMKMNRDHTVPLSSAMTRLLEELRSLSGHRGWLFPSDLSPRKPMSSQSANMALKRMGFKGRLVSHGFRALASTTLNEHGFDPELIETALAHVDSNSVRAAYNRAEYLERRREMMEWWSTHIINTNQNIQQISRDRENTHDDITRSDLYEKNHSSIPKNNYAYALTGKVPDLKTGKMPNLNKSKEAIQLRMAKLQQKLQRRGIDKINLGKDHAKELARFIAKELWKMYPEKRMGEICDLTKGVFIDQVHRPNVPNDAREGYLVALPEDAKTLREWLKPIAPKSASKGGRPRKK